VQANTHNYSFELQARHFEPLVVHGRFEILLDTFSFPKWRVGSLSKEYTGSTEGFGFDPPLIFRGKRILLVLLVGPSLNTECRVSISRLDNLKYRYDSPIDPVFERVDVHGSRR
jgi:hypothetical protein